MRTDCTHHVYVIGETLEDPPYLHSYVGVSKELPARWGRHIKDDFYVGRSIRKHGWTIDNMRIIFSGSADECYALEKSLRPKSGIGLNESAGGRGGHNVSTIDRNTKISLSTKGKPKPSVKGSKNAKAKKWNLRAPDGTRHSLHGSFSTFCDEHDLLYPALIRHRGTVVPEPNFSGYGGFRSKNENSLRRRLNTTGWILEDDNY